VMFMYFALKGEVHEHHRTIGEFSNTIRVPRPYSAASSE
jgi:hypothetical protein